MSNKPKTKSGLEVRTVDDEKVILDRDGEHIHQLNATASFIWDLCDGSREISTIAEELGDAFGVDADSTLKDVSDVLSQFSELGLLEEVSIED